MKEKLGHRARVGATQHAETVERHVPLEVEKGFLTLRLADMV